MIDLNHRVAVLTNQNKALEKINETLTTQVDYLQKQNVILMDRVINQNAPGPGEMSMFDAITEMRTRESAPATKLMDHPEMQNWVQAGNELYDDGFDFEDEVIASLSEQE